MLFITTVPVEGSDDIIFKPTLDEIRDLLHYAYKKVLEVNHKMPRVEKKMFPGSNLFPFPAPTVPR